MKQEKRVKEQELKKQWRAQYERKFGGYVPTIVWGRFGRGKDAYDKWIAHQAALHARTPKMCSCYLCTVSTKRDGYSIKDKRRIVDMQAQLKEDTML